MPIVEMVIFMGAQAAGKTSYYKFRFFETHVRVNLDMLRTRNREKFLVEACLQSKQPFVVDNTNVTVADRQQYLRLASAHSFSVVGYYFQSIAAECVARNAKRNRDPLPVVPSVAIRGTISRFEHPTFCEGFDQLYFVRIENNSFMVEKWKDEI